MECGVLEFGGKALSEDVWVGFRPSVLEGISEYRGRALGGCVGAGLRSVGSREDPRAED